MKKGVVLITGASGGIGAATALQFAHRGYPVALGYHQNRRAAEQLCNTILEQGHEAMLCKGDVSQEEDVHSVFDSVEKTLGPVMILVNNAGHSEQKLFTQITKDEWDLMFNVHVRGCFLCCQRAAGPMIQKKQGHIINVASMWGQIGASCEVHYAAAKAAVIGLTKSLAKEWATCNIQVNCVAPGAIDTAMLEDLQGADRAQLCEETPLGRIGSADEVASTIAFLASDGASFFTGQVLSPNGGFVM